jgi:hypothetical protein
MWCRLAAQKIERLRKHAARGSRSNICFFQRETAPGMTVGGLFCADRSVRVRRAQPLQERNEIERVAPLRAAAPARFCRFQGTRYHSQ